MVGQQVIQDTINNFIDTGTLPNSIIFSGGWGCGKHTLVNELSEKLEIPVEDITDKVTLATIQEILISSTPCLYIIDTDKINVKEQNALLKLLEEPPKTSYLCLLTTDKSNLLPTIVNRCFLLQFNPYTENELKFFTQDKEILDLVTTPGRALQLSNTDLEPYKALITKLFTKLHTASESNVLSIPNKFYYKAPEENKLDFELFTFLLLKMSLDAYTSNLITFKFYLTVLSFIDSSRTPHIALPQLFENTLITLKMLVG